MAWIYQVGSMGSAHIKAAIVDTPGMADLCVFLVESVGMASGDAYWFIDRSKESARTWVYFPANIGMADIKICFVKSRAMAGWKTNHILEGKFR